MDNRRLILLLVFCFSLVMLWDAWQTYNQPKVAAQIAALTTSANGLPVPIPSATQPAPASKTAVPALASASKAVLGEVVSIKTDLFVADVALLGGDIIGLELKNYKESNDKKKDLSSSCSVRITTILVHDPTWIVYFSTCF